MTNIQDLLGDKSKMDALSTIISLFNLSHPYDRLHIIAHIMERLDDPQAKVCKAHEEVVGKILKIYTRDEVEILLDEIMPKPEEMFLAKKLNGGIGPDSAIEALNAAGVKRKIQ